MPSMESLEIKALFPLDTERDPDAEDLAEIGEIKPGELEEGIKTVADEPFEDAIKLYLRDVHRNNLLSAEEERETAPGSGPD